MTVTAITSLQEFKELTSGDKPIVIDFWATWCGPCRAISPIFEQFSALDAYSNVGFYKVDVDAVPDVAEEVGIRAMPTFAVFKSGSKVDELVGANRGALETLLVKNGA